MNGTLPAAGGGRGGRVGPTISGGLMWADGAGNDVYTHVVGRLTHRLHPPDPCGSTPLNLNIHYI